MTKSVTRLVPKGSRRKEYSATTRRALIDVAERLFTEHGYAATSLDSIVSGARVTKGARVETAIGFILAGLQGLAASGAPLPDPLAGPGDAATTSS